MEIKMGRDTYTVSNRDVIMDNGAVILVKTKGAYMSRKLFNELLKKGVIVPYEALMSYSVNTKASSITGLTTWITPVRQWCIDSRLKQSMQRLR